MTRPTKPGATEAAGSKKKPKGNQKKNKSSVRNDNDDTPKAFKRMMQQMQNQQTGRKPGQPEGSVAPTPRKQETQDNTKKSAASADTRKATNEPTKPAEKPTQDQKGLKILPGERLSEFASRVNQSLPLAGIAKKGGPTEPDLKIRHKQTKHEKKLRRLQEGWREEEAKIREREEERKEEMEEKTAELDALWRSWQIEAGIKRRQDDDDEDSGRKKKKKKKRRN